MRRAAWFPAVCAALCISSTNLLAQARPPDWQAGLSLSYYTGDYGTDEDTDMIYMPVTLKRYLDKGEVGLVVPYISIDSSGGATVVDGEVLDTGGGDSSGSGLGDILVKGKYYAVQQEPGKHPFVDLTARVKLPAADDADGLGTGEMDIGFGIECSYVHKRKYIGFADAEYVFIGNPEDIEYKNRIIVDFGFGYRLDAQTTLSAFYERRTALLSSNDDPQSIIFFADHKLRPDLKLEALIELGLSDGAADYGLTAGAKKYF